MEKRYSLDSRRGPLIAYTDEINGAAAISMLTSMRDLGTVSPDFPGILMTFDTVWDWMSLRRQNGNWIAKEPDFDADPYSDQGKTEHLKLLPIFYEMQRVMQRISVTCCELTDWRTSVCWEVEALKGDRIFLSRPDTSRVWNDSGWFISAKYGIPSEEHRFDELAFDEKRHWGDRLCDLLDVRPSALYPMALPAGKYIVEMVCSEIVAVYDYQGRDLWGSGAKSREPPQPF
jgi:hypothetical protein